MRGPGIINAAFEQLAAWRRPSVKAADSVFGPRQSRLRNTSLQSTALATVPVLVGFGAVTPFIVAAILNPSVPSIANDGRTGVMTASIAAAPLPEKGETIIPKLPGDVMQSAELRQAVGGPDRDSNRGHLTLSVGARPSAELDNLTEVFRTELQNAEPASDVQDDTQPKPERTEQVGLATEPLQPEETESIPKPEPRPSNLAAREPGSSTRSARVRSDVRMRAAPRNRAAVVTVVRGGSEVQVVNCRYWCEVTFNGKRGWIYKRFIQGAGS